MKFTLSEIKKNLQGTNNEDEVEDQINDLEHKKKTFNQKIKKLKKNPK